MGVAQPDLIYADAGGKAVGEIAAYEGDFAVGEENDFAITAEVQTAALLTRGTRVYLDGTPFGGVVDSVEIDTKAHTATVGGRTAEGVLASRFLLPDAGVDYLTVSGEANAVLAKLVARLGLGGFFRMATDKTDILIAHQFDRFQDAYTGICDMLRASGAKLVVSFSAGVATLAATKIVDLSGTYELDNDLCDFTAKTARPVNHLICAGKGDLAARDVIHLYADGNGVVSTSQTFFGVDEVQDFYDYNNAEHADLLADGIKKLTDYQLCDACDVTDIYDMSLCVGDIVGARYNDPDITAKALIVGKIARVKNGRISYQLKAGQAQAASSRSGTPNTGGGVSYVAGNNISITGNTISATVGLPDIKRLDDKYAATLTAASNASAAAGAAEEQARLSAASSTAASQQASNAASAAGTASTSATAAQGSAKNADASASSASSAAAKSEVAASQSAASASAAEKAASASAASASTAATKASGAEAKATSADVKASAAEAKAASAEASASTAVAEATSAKTAASDAVTASAGANKQASSAETKAGDAATKAASAVSVAEEAKRIAQDAASGGFLAAWPVGSYITTSDGKNPGATYGGLWAEIPSIGAYKWHRTS